MGRSDAEIKVGNFLAPLFVWMDESLAQPTTFRPRTVSMVASQVDLAPTILSLTGLMPALTPFVGRDLSCALIRECQEDNVAYFTNGGENLIGLVDSGRNLDVPGPDADGRRDGSRGARTVPRAGGNRSRRGAAPAAPVVALCDGQPAHRGKPPLIHAEILGPEVTASEHTRGATDRSVSPREELVEPRGLELER